MKIFKFIMLLGIVGSLFTNCKKDYTCKCDITRTTSSSSFYSEEKGTSITNIANVNKQHANQSCTSSFEETTSSTGSTAVTYTYLKNCHLNTR